METTRNAGQMIVWGTMGAEAIECIHDLRWMIALVVILIFADFRFGMAESRKRKKEAQVLGNRTLMKMYDFRLSRAIRRTCNKFVDYMTLLLVFCCIGLAVTEPYGLCSHVITAGAAMIIASVSELASVLGHFLYLRGITVHMPKMSWKSVGVFVGRFAAGIARTKSPDLGDALDETIEKTFMENKEEGK